MSDSTARHFQEVKAGLVHQIAQLEKRIAQATVELEAHRTHLKSVDAIIAKFPKPPAPPETG